jgi:hypothetical protein
LDQDFLLAFLKIKVLIDFLLCKLVIYLELQQILVGNDLVLDYLLFLSSLKNPIPYQRC